MEHDMSLEVSVLVSHGHTYLVGVVVRVANHMVHPVWLRRAYGTNGCLLLDNLASGGNRIKDKSESRRVCSAFPFFMINFSFVCYKLCWLVGSSLKPIKAPSKSFLRRGTPTISQRDMSWKSTGTVADPLPAVWNLLWRHHHHHHHHHHH